MMCMRCGTTTATATAAAAATETETVVVTIENGILHNVSIACFYSPTDD